MDLRRAACAGQDPVLFDAFTFPDAHAGLTFCWECPVVEECVIYVRPSKSFFDGVCGGVVWRNGYKVRADNSTREDRLRQRRGEVDQIATVSPLYGQRTLPFDGP